MIVLTSSAVGQRQDKDLPLVLQGADFLVVLPDDRGLVPHVQRVMPDLGIIEIA